MRKSSKSVAPRMVDPWAPYSPSDECPWNLRRVVHLHRRAGFVATWRELERDLKDGPEPSLERVLAGRASTDGVPEKFEETAHLLSESALSSGDPARLKAWWVYRMLFGPEPLTERLTLFWHNHFATSNLKVENLAFMRRQNELFRQLGRGPFRELLTAVVHDPALLIWLDAPSNRKGHPNENLARELMELFSLGIGHYTEHDVKEAARALTGWSIKRGCFAQVPDHHDAGEKAILGNTGHWVGDDLVRMVLEHPATSGRLARRVCELFLTEKATKSAPLNALAEGLRLRDLDIGWAVKTVLSSQVFFDDLNIGDRVQSPVEYVIGAARVLETFEPPCSTLILAEWCGRLGQDLFYPPNVGGWPGGRSWLTTRSVIGRANFAAGLVDGKWIDGQKPLDALALARAHGENDVIAFYARLLLGTEPTQDWRARIGARLAPKTNDGGDCARRLVKLALTMPEAQVV